MGSSSKGLGGFEMTKILKLIKRYDINNVDQEFFDLEFARFEHERQKEIQWEKEELTRLIITGKGEYYKIKQRGIN